MSRRRENLGGSGPYHTTDSWLEDNRQTQRHRDAETRRHRDTGTQRHRVTETQEWILILRSLKEERKEKQNDGTQYGTI